MTYSDFLASKAIRSIPTGIQNPGEPPAMLFPFQRDIVKWALRRGRAAIFADCGLGKTPMQLSWADQVPGRVLILAPLAVAQQTVREGQKFGIDMTYARTPGDARITITNYEMLDRFDPSTYSGVVLDESSILKSYDGKFRNQIIEAFRNTPFKLACTATPAPNDHMELGNHSEFLGVLSRTEMLSTFFVHDGGDTNVWRLKGHARSDFWRWVCSWAVMIRKPSDLGYEDGKFILPPLEMHSHIVETLSTPEGALFAIEATTLQERQQARKITTGERCQAVAEIVMRMPCGNQNMQLIAERNTKAIPPSENAGRLNADRQKKTPSTCGSITPSTRMDGIGAPVSNEHPSMPNDDGNMPLIPNIGSASKGLLRHGRVQTQGRGSISASVNLESLPMITNECSQSRTANAQSAVQMIQGTEGGIGSMLTIAMQPERSAVCSAAPATSGSGSLKMIPNGSEGQWIIWCNLNNEADSIEDMIPGSVQVAGSDSMEFKEQAVIDFLEGRTRVLISKPSIFGFGLNLQCCANMVFLGLSDSYEQFYQAVRRCWRFGQERPVHCHIVTSDIEGAVVENIKRKEADAARMAEEMVANMQDINAAEIRGVVRTAEEYRPTVEMELPLWMRAA